jgi:ABC-type nitrate/sulfonate/bicarbonate transport system ATPase subunit
MSDKQLRLEAVSHSFGSHQVLHKFCLDITRGEFVVLVGPSGCGKTTILNLMAGFSQPTSGTIVRTCKTHMVYQSDGLFPWMTVEENIGLGVRHLKDKDQREATLSSLVRLIQLEGFEKHYPYQLSGGMRQRVELARALAGDKGVLLMDEPFSSLDYQTRLRMRRELLRILAVKPCTVVFVTHDIEEATQLADRIVVLTGKPTKIKYEIRLDLEHPRDISHPTITDAMKRILGEFGLRYGEEDYATVEDQDSVFTPVGQ